MSLTQNEFEVILSDPSKSIDADIAWTEDEDHSPSVEFRAEVNSEAGVSAVHPGELQRPRTDADVHIDPSGSGAHLRT